ncbi:MAG: DUF4396 domain-containing protein [Betaproteobacteria bacterium]
MITGIITVWFILTALSALFVTHDLLTNTPAMGVMKLGWVLVVLYTGPVGLFIYLLSCREPLPGTHELFVAPLWKQAVGSTIHCLAGDATGIILAAVITSWFELPRALDIVIEYAAGFAFGLFIFQALFMKGMMGGSYLRAVQRTILPEWLSMNAIMAGMIPIMVSLMARVPGAMGASHPEFWWVMSMAAIVGGILAFPVNYWLVSNHLKHGMGTVRAIGKGGHSVELEQGMEAQREQAAMHGEHGAQKKSAVSPGRIVVISALTLFMLAAGSVIAALLG